MDFFVIFELIIPILIVFVIVYALIKGVDVYDAFVAGAKKGLGTAFKILPYIAAMLISLAVFRGAGGLDIVNSLLTPIFSLFGVPAEVVPLVLLRPFSGGAAMGIFAELLNEHGADSYIGRLASTLLGSTETIFYTVALYFGSVGIKNSRHTILAALIAGLAGFISSVIICSIAFG